MFISFYIVLHNFEHDLLHAIENLATITFHILSSRYETVQGAQPKMPCRHVRITVLFFKAEHKAPQYLQGLARYKANWRSK